MSRKITQKAVYAFIEGKKFNKSNMEIEVENVATV